jgi:hypothetical protein
MRFKNQRISDNSKSLLLHLRIKILQRNWPLVAKRKGKDVPIHVIKIYSGSWGIAPLILNLGTRWRSNSRSGCFYLQGNNPRYPVSPLWTFWRIKIYFALPWFEIRILQIVAWSVYRLSYPGYEIKPNCISFQTPTDESDGKCKKKKRNTVPFGITHGRDERMKCQNKNIFSLILLLLSG